VGAIEGIIVGSTEGIIVGSIVGIMVGSIEGIIEGIIVGIIVGISDNTVGSLEFDGAVEGAVVSDMVVSTSNPVRLAKEVGSAALRSSRNWVPDSSKIFKASRSSGAAVKPSDDVIQRSRTRPVKSLR